jgi:transcriptional regulator with XRE-family HTH domain
MVREGSDIHNLYDSDHSPTKIRQSGPGRRAKRVDASKNPLGSFLQERLESRRITQKDLAQRLGISRDMVRRLIYTDFIEINSSLVEPIVRILDLNEMEREDFQKLLAGNKNIEGLPLELQEMASEITSENDSPGLWLSLPDAGISLVVPEKARKTARKKHGDERGRKGVEPVTDVGRFLAEHLRAKGMKRSDLARAAGVVPSTVTRLMQGDIAVIRQDTKERICRELDLDDAARIEFDRLTTKEPRATIWVHKFSHIDLDKLTISLQELQGLYEKGRVEYVWLEAHRFYLLLKKAEFSKKESRAIELQWRFGMLGGSANEAVLAWEERVSPTINFYTLIESEIYSREVPPQQADIYIAHIKARRAPLYRQLEQYQNSLNEFSEALDVYIHHTDTSEDRRLLVELYYSRAHVYAVLGQKELWERDIKLAEMHAREEKDEMRRRELVGLVIYTQGEGYKRLAFNDRRFFSREAKIEFAQKGLECFKISHMEESKWVGHGILNGVARAQCLAFIDPAAALKEAERLRNDAVQRYPSIVQKIDRIMDYAHERLV